MDGTLISCLVSFTFFTIWIGTLSLEEEVCLTQRNLFGG